MKSQYGINVYDRWSAGLVLYYFDIGISGLSASSILNFNEKHDGVRIYFYWLRFIMLQNPVVKLWNADSRYFELLKKRILYCSIFTTKKPNGLMGVYGIMFVLVFSKSGITITLGALPLLKLKVYCISNAASTITIYDTTE